MMERTRPPREGGSGSPSILGSPFGPRADQGGPVNVSHFPYTESLPVGGMSVAQIRSRFRDRFDIDPTSQAVLDGDEVGDDTVVRAGQSLAFIRRAGEKG
ncbi:MAG: hypothetical protein FJ290_04755 [Planctomycetes bacterium]|nr:hypothetical protein [Planctomycetota bacterium]